MTRPMLVVRIIMEDKIVTRMKTQIFKSSALFTISALTLCLALTAISISPAAGGEDELILTLDGWRTKSGSQDISISSERATRGEKSVRIDYVTAGWQMVRYVFADRGVEDWRGGDVFEFDLYIDHPEPLHTLRIRLSEQETGNFFAYRQPHYELPVQKWIRFSIPLRRGPGQEDPFPELARNSMGRLKLRLWGARPPDHPRKDITLYIDNMRVVSTAERRREALGSKLRIIAESDLLSGHEPNQVEVLQERLERVDSASFDDQEKLEEATDNLLAIEDEAEALIDKVIERSLNRHSLPLTASLFKNLGRAEKEYDRPWRTLAEIEEAREEPGLVARVRALHQAMSMAEERVENVRLRTDIERFYKDGDFAIGIPDYPQAWRSDGYDGPIGRQVNLRAARNEFEPFQLVIIAHRGELRNVRVEATDLQSEADVIAADNVEIAPMGWRELKGEKDQLADDLRSYKNTFNVDRGKHQPVWINVYVPEDTPPGEYRGTVTVEAEGAEAESVDVSLRVWPFTLPKFSSLGTATWCSPAFRLPSGQREEYAQAVIERRWDPFQMYIWIDDAPLPLEYMRKLTKMGASRHNLLRISRNAASFSEDEDGNPVVTNKDFFFRRLDPIVDEIMEKDPGFMDHVALYGFDEPGRSQALAMDDFYGDLKKRYHGIRTMFADLYGMWDLLPELPENVDVWAANRGTLSANAVELIQNAGMEVWWYNIYNNQEDPVGLRVQFWSTFKDGFDGLLHYNIDGRDIMRLGPEKQPVPSVAFEYWREGMEDVEYLYLLRERREELAERAGDNPTDEQRNLLREADRLLRIPDTITTGLLGDRAVDVGEVVVETSGHTENMKEILAARIEIAELIVEIDEELDRL